MRPPLINLKGFIGEQPRLLPRLMADMAAQSAINTRLDDGGLTPIRDSTLIKKLTGLTAPKSIYLFNSTWLGWDTEVHPVPGPVATDRLYYTGDGKPKMRVGSTVYDLKVPFPTGALTATLGGTGSGDTQSRLYVYTYVTDYGEESEPCPASNSIDWKPGNTVTLSGFAAPPSGRNITKQRIYRTQTGLTGTQFYFIAERTAATTNFTDDIAVDGYAEALPSASYNAPPDGLSGLVSLPNGILAGFVGRSVYFSEQYLPHAWPEKYAMTVEHDIIGLGVVGSSLVVMTKGEPSIMQGNLPGSMVETKIEQNLPCINSRGIVDLGSVVAYPSNEGLVVVDAAGGFAIATRPIFNRDAWLALDPATMVAGQISGRYVAFYSTTAADGSADAGSLLIDISEQSYLIRSSALGTAAWYDISSGALYYVAADTTDIYRFDSPNAQRLYQYWKSKEYVLPWPDNYGAIRIDTIETLSGDEQQARADAIAAAQAENAAVIAAGSIGGDIASGPLNEHPVGGDNLKILPNTDVPTISVTVFGDGSAIAAFTKSNTVLRLPAKDRYRKFEIAVFSNARVEQISLGKTPDDLKGAY